MAESRARSLANLGNQNALSVDSSSLDVGISSASPDSDLNVGASIKMDGPSGIITASKFSGDGSLLIGVASTDNIITGTAATFNNEVDVNGFLNVGANIQLGTAGVITATSFTGDGANLTNVGVDTATVDTGSLKVSGISTLSGYVSLGSTVGAAASIYFPDDKGINFGNNAEGDLQIYHDGSNSYIKDSGTGGLLINSSGFDVLNAADNEYMARFIQDSGVELYNNNEKKWATGSNGVYHDHNGTLHENAIHFQVAQNSSDYATLFGVTNYPDHSSYTSQSMGHWARIQAKGGSVVLINSDATNRNDGRNGIDHFSVYQRAGESTNGKRLFSVDGEGAAQFGRAGIRIDNSWGGQPSITVQRNNNDGTDNTNDGAYMRVHGIGETHETWTGAGSAGADFSANFIIDGSTYATSDRRAKTDIVDCPYGLDVVNKLQPRKYQLVNSQLTPQGDDNINLGFIAQEIKEHIPECVNYLGDEANTPNEKGWARAYALDIGEVIPVLVKAIQELSAQVTALKAA